MHLLTFNGEDTTLEEEGGSESVLVLSSKCLLRASHEVKLRVCCCLFLPTAF